MVLIRFFLFSMNVIKFSVLLEMEKKKQANIIMWLSISCKNAIIIFYSYGHIIEKSF